MLEAWFFFVLISGGGKTSAVVGPFTARADCEEHRKAIASTSITYVSHVCWVGPVGASAPKVGAK